MNRTSWNPDWSAAIARITTLVEAMFSCRAKFSTIETFLNPMSRSAYLEQDLVFLESTLFEPPNMIRSVQPGRFAFPLRVRRTGAPASDVSLVGIATIEGLASGDDERLKQIAEFLHLAVESRLDAFERLLDIEQRERMLETEQSLRESSKVIRLFPRLGPRADRSAHDADEMSSATDLDTFLLPETRADLTLSKPLLLVADRLARSNTATYEKIALEIFNRTSLWFFVGIQDLSEDAFRSAQSFRELGRMCIFIPNIASLSTEKQLRLAEVFNAPTTEGDVPCIIAFTQEDPTELAAKGVLVPHLLEGLAMIHLPANATAPAEIDGRSIRSLVRDIETTLMGSTAPRRQGNLIPLMGKWHPDDSPNPTFH